MTSDPNSWLPSLIGPDTILVDGERVNPVRRSLNLVGATQEDDPDNDQTNITIPGGGGGATPGGPEGSVQARGPGSTFTGIAPGASGNVLTSVGDGWVSAPASGGSAPGGSDGEAQYKNGTALAGATNVTMGSNFTAWGSGTKPTTGHQRFPAPTGGLGSKRSIATQKRVNGAGDLDLVSIYESVGSSDSVVFGSPNHYYTTLVGSTAFLASALGTQGAGSGSYFGVRPDGLAFVSLAGGSNRQIEFSSNIITDYAIELSPDVGGVVEWKTSQPVTNYRVSFYRGGAPVRWLDASSTQIVLGYALSNVVPIRLDAKEVRQGNSVDNLRTTNVLDQVQTTDGTTWVDIYSVDLATSDNDAITVLEFEAQGIKNDASLACTLKKRRAFRMAAGTLTALVEGSLHSDVASLAGDTRFTTTGSIAKAQVKGVAATTIDWTGAIIRAKSKASGAAPFNPATGTASTCRLWLRSDLGLTADSGTLVSAWLDQSGQGDSNRNAAAAGSARPGYTSSNVNYNGRPTVNFTSAAHRMATGVWSAAVAQVFTVVLVGRAISSGANGYWYESLNGASHLRENNSSGLIAYAGTVLARGTTNAPAVVLVEFNGASTAVYETKRSVTGTVGNAGTGGLTGMYIGNETGSAGYLNGELAEILVYSGVLSSGDKTAVFDYLEARYAITLAP